MKICSRCDIERPPTEYFKHPDNVDGRHGVCKICKREIQRAYKAKNREEINRKQREARAADGGRHNAWCSARRAEVLQRTPSWANKEAIDFRYFAADVIHKVYGGTKPHVDHDIPLKGEKYGVCGLHVENNLVIRSAKDNMAKSNKYEVA